MLREKGEEATNRKQTSDNGKREPSSTIEINSNLKSKAWHFMKQNQENCNIQCLYTANRRIAMLTFHSHRTADQVTTFEQWDKLQITKILIAKDFRTISADGSIENDEIEVLLDHWLDVE